MPTGAGSAIFIGLMSGTSLDGVDIAIVDFNSNPPRPLFCSTESYPADIRNRLTDIIRAETVAIDELCRLDVEIARFYADVVNQALVSSSIERDLIQAIGCHGQTIRHSPDIDPVYTLQIGDPNTLAANCGITTIADFRRRDMALGGQGAPLAPGFHQHMFRSAECDRAIINIGGIANITYLPRDPRKNVIGFDTGPGNTLLDYWILLNQGKNLDENGNWAASGKVIEDLLDCMIKQETYFNQSLPKSTGTEYFCPDWLNGYLSGSHEAADIQATLLELSAKTIAIGIAQLPSVPEECFICGGGVHNQTLVARLQQLLAETKLSSTAHLAVDPDYVEAMAFAWLAGETLHGRPGNLPTVTNASDSAILGGIFTGSLPAKPTPEL